MTTREFAEFHAGCAVFGGRIVAYSTDGRDEVIVDGPGEHFLGPSTTWTAVVDDARHGSWFSRAHVERNLMCIHPKAKARAEAVPSSYPHTCALCGGRAYIGFSTVEHEGTRSSRCTRPL